MIARLVGDALWRNRWFYVSSSVAILSFWHLFGQSRPTAFPIPVTALSLISASVMGPVFATTTTGLRAFRHMPFSNRDLWRTTWILATVVPAAVLLVSKTLSALLVMVFGGAPNVSAEMVLLSVLYDFAWAGALLPVLPLQIFADASLDHRGRLAATLAEVSRAVALVAFFGLPVLLSDALPAHVGEFTSLTAVILVAALAIAFGTLAWTPQRGLLAGERGRHQRAVPPAGAATRTRLAERLTGISRVAVPHLLATLMLPVGACLPLAGYGVISGSGPWWFVPAKPEMFDPMDIRYFGLTCFVLLPCMAVTVQGPWTPWVRLLKVLPLSVRQTNALMLLTPFATWPILWLVWWSAYSFAYGTPPALRVGFVFGMAALGTLAQAVLLRVQGSTASGWIFGLIATLMPAFVKLGLRDGTGTQVVFAVIGAIALGTAAFLNHRTLTRSTSASRVYRPALAPFGVIVTPSNR